MGVHEVTRIVHAPDGDLLKVKPVNTSSSFLVLGQAFTATGIFSSV
jgi:hypothetical protein